MTVTLPTGTCAALHSAPSGPRFAPCFVRARVGRMNFRSKEQLLKAIYAAHGWERYLKPEHEIEVRAALQPLLR